MIVVCAAPVTASHALALLQRGGYKGVQSMLSRVMVGFAGATVAGAPLLLIAVRGRQVTCSTATSPDACAFPVYALSMLGPIAVLLLGMWVGYGKLTDKRISRWKPHLAQFVMFALCVATPLASAVWFTTGDTPIPWLQALLLAYLYLRVVTSFMVLWGWMLLMISHIMWTTYALAELSASVLSDLSLRHGLVRPARIAQASAAPERSKESQRAMVQCGAAGLGIIDSAFLDPREPSHVMFLLTVRQVIETIGDNLLKGSYGVILVGCLSLALVFLGGMGARLVFPDVLGPVEAAPFYAAAAGLALVVAVGLLVFIVSAAADSNQAHKQFKTTMASLQASASFWVTSFATARPEAGQGAGRAPGGGGEAEGKPLEARPSKPGTPSPPTEAKTSAPKEGLAPPPTLLRPLVPQGLVTEFDAPRTATAVYHGMPRESSTSPDTQDGRTLEFMTQVLAKCTGTARIQETRHAVMVRTSPACDAPVCGVLRRRVPYLAHGFAIDEAGNRWMKVAVTPSSGEAEAASPGWALEAALGLTVDGLPAHMPPSAVDVMRERQRLAGVRALPEQERCERVWRLLTAALNDAELSPLQLKLFGVVMDAKLRAALVSGAITLTTAIVGTVSG